MFINTIVLPTCPNCFAMMIAKLEIRAEKALTTNTEAPQTETELTGFVCPHCGHKKKVAE